MEPPDNACTAHLTSGDWCYLPADHDGQHKADWGSVVVLFTGDEKWARS